MSLIKKKLTDIRRQKDLEFFHSHRCSVTYCDPLNPDGLRRRGFMVPTDLRDDVFYICRYGAIHECGTAACMDHGEVCPVSGASFGLEDEYSSYNPKDARTWRMDPVPEAMDASGTTVAMRTALVPDASTPLVYMAAESLVETILYSEKRTEIYARWRRSQAKRAKRDIDCHVANSQKQRVPINLVQLRMLEDPQAASITVLGPRDAETVERYATLITRMHSLVARWPVEKTSVEAEGIALLYKMQQSKVVDGVTLIPKDPFLVENLPLMNDLPTLKVDKTKYTKGERLIEGMYEMARREGKTWEELAL